MSANARGLARPRPARTLAAFAAGLMLVATSVAASYALIDAGLLDAATQTLDGPLAGIQAPAGEPLAAVGGIEVVDNAQISQPRDPFRPLISPESPIFGQPGVGGAGITGGGFEPTVTIALVDVRDVGGVLRATVTVNGESFDVGVGDTFAEVYKVVSLTEDSGVFMFGDNAFELQVGQQILK